MKGYFIIVFHSCLLFYSCISDQIAAPQEVDAFEKIVLCGDSPRKLHYNIYEYSYFIDNTLVDSITFSNAVNSEKLKYIWHERLFENRKIVDTNFIDNRPIPRYQINILTNGISKENYLKNQTRIDNLDVHINHIGLIGIAVNHTVDGTGNMNIGLYVKETGERMLYVQEREFTGRFYRLLYSDKLGPSTDVRAVVIIGDKIGYEDFTLVQTVDKPGTIESTIHSENINNRFE